MREGKSRKIYITESQCRLLAEAKMDFSNLYNLRHNENITEYVINYINWSGRGEFDASFSMLASRLHDGLMHTLGLNHENQRDRRAFARIISYCRTILKTIDIEKIETAMFGYGWHISTNHHKGNWAMMHIDPDDFKNGEYSHGNLLHRAIAFESRDGVKKLNSIYRPGSSNGSTGIYCTSAIMTDEMQQKIRGMGLVPALCIDGSYHENFVDSVGVLPKYVPYIKKSYGNIIFDCKFDFPDMEEDDYEDEGDYYEDEY